MDKQIFDCVVIGSGPGGYVAAIKAASRGLKTALIEAEDIGGVCLNCGCIPSKTLIANAEALRKIQNANRFGIYTDTVSFRYEEMKKRKDQVVGKMRRGLEGLIASNQIKIFKGFGKFLSPNEIKVLGENDAILETKNAIIATGSYSKSLPFISLDYEVIHDSTSFLNITHLPKKLIVIGGGVIGCEFASMHQAFGVDVTIIELLPSLVLTEGTQISEALTASFKKQGIKVETGALITGVVREGDEVVVLLKDERTLRADMALVAVGRGFNSTNLGLENTGVIVDKNGTIPINEYMQTNVSHIYAIGDVTGKWILAHAASHQGILAADHICGIKKKMHGNAVPSVIFTHPEIASVGLTLERALKEGYDATIGKFPFQALGKSQAILETEGFAQVVIDKKTGLILGAQVMGYGAATLIAEMTVAITNELTTSCITETIHAHPTISEAWMEAALLASDMPLHLPPRDRK